MVAIIPIVKDHAARFAIHHLSVGKQLVGLSVVELNPQENIWQFIRDNWLSNRVFKSYDDIVDHCCYAWNKLIDQPWKIMSIGMRDWAYQF